MKYCFIIGFALFFLGFLFLKTAETFAGFCFFVSFILIPIGIILFFIKIIRTMSTNKQHAPAKIKNLRPFLCSVSNLRKKDGNVVRGDCMFAFDDNLFIISQSDEKIINDIDSIYYFDVWEHKDETYFKIVMRSHTEYIFKSIRFEADKIADYLKQKGIKIEDNRE